MQNPRLDEAQLESRLLGEISITSDMQTTPLLRQEARETKEPLDKGEKREWKSWLKTQHSKNKDPSILSHQFMANWWGNNGSSERLYLFFWGGVPKSLQMVTSAIKLKYTCSLEAAMTILDSILKSRDITLPTKVHVVKAMVFPAVMYGCESWTIKKAECWRIDDFELWCWRRFLRVSWTARISNQSILKEISPQYSLQGLML